MGVAMHSIKRRVLVALIPAALTAALVGGVVGAVPAQAYGTDHAYQLTFSLNCDNKSSPLCAPESQGGFGLGGVWGWIEPDSDGTADATVTFCAHGQGQNGAFHENLDEVAWTIESGSHLGGLFPVGTDPNNRYIVFPNSDLGFIAFPATPNHYSLRLAPGVTAQATVVRMH